LEQPLAFGYLEVGLVLGLVLRFELAFGHFEVEL
jgi:hypothetical protein